MTPEQVRQAPITVGLLAGVVDALALRHRVPELLKLRGWPVTEQLVELLSIAVAYRKLADQAYLAATGRPRLDSQIILRRPPEADGFGNKWPVDRSKVTAHDLCDQLDLLALLEYQ